MDIQVSTRLKSSGRKSARKRLKSSKRSPKRVKGPPTTLCACTSRRWALSPFLTREEEVEISKRIEKAQIQIERIIMRFRYSNREAISIANYLIAGKERFDKIIAKKRWRTSTAFSSFFRGLRSF